MNVRLLAPLTAAATLALVLSGCSAGAAPSATASGGATHVAVTLTGDNGGTCSLDAATAAAGPVTFTVTNQSATSITEIELLSGDRIVGEKENLAPGLSSASFTVTLDGGSYQLYCPGAATETIPFSVTGQAATPTGSAASLMAEGTQGYATYVDGVVDSMVTAVATLKSSIDAGDLTKAQADYALARPFYERIESDVDGFVLPGHSATDNAGSLDYLIDMRESNLDPAVGWHGFHAIERDLFQAGAITASTTQLAAELLTNVTTLDSLVKTLSYKPEDLANGAASLLEEVQSGKISGEEEAYSHI
ncbi:EfeM/EfeO family lipoprotein, partial [Microbacterium sp. Leaf351]